MDISTKIVLVLIIGLLSTACIDNVFNWLRILYYNHKEKKERFYKSNTYIVGFPSGEIIFLDSDKRIELLLNKGYLKWFNEYKRFCYRDYDKKIIEKLLKF